MPVEFLCPGCRATLSVARRKIGSGTECPRCHAQLVVPEEGSARAEVALAKLERSARKRRRAERRLDLNVKSPPRHVEPREDHWSAPEPPFPEGSNWRNIEDAADDAPPVVIAEPPPIARWQDEAQRAISIQQPSLAEGLRARRREFIARVALGVAMGAAGFVLGYALARRQNAQDAAVAGDTGPILVEGRITFSDSVGAKRGDGGALVLVVPVAPTPAVKLRLLSLDSWDGHAADVNSDEFARIGGAVAKADENGGFTLVVPAPNEYRVLWISRQSNRVENEMPSASDLDILGDYFTSPIDLIGLRRYSLTRQRIDGTTTKLDHTIPVD